MLPRAEFFVRRSLRKFSSRTAHPGQKIAVIPLEGIIAYNQSGSLGEDVVQGFKNALEQARTDAQVKAVVISVDSPGGEITASDVLYNSLERIQQGEAVGDLL